MFSLRSLFGLTLSVLVHGSVGAYFLTHTYKAEPTKPKKIAMQMSMFKIAPPPKPIEKLPKLKPVAVAPTEKPVVKEVVKLDAPKPILLETPKIVTKPEVEKIISKPKPAVEEKVAVIKPIPKPPIKVKPKLKKKVKKKVKLKKKKVIKPKKVVVKKKPKLKPRKVAPPKRKAIVQKRVIKKAHNRRKAPSHRASPRKAIPKRVVRHAKPTQRATVQKHGRPKSQLIRKPNQVVKATPVIRQATQPRVVSNPHLERQYEQGIRQRIEQKKKYPRRAKRMRKQGVVKVAFTITRNGILSKLRIVQSSGVTSLDKATLQAVKKVGRFPAIPPGIRKQSLSYIIPISYRLR